MTNKYIRIAVNIERDPKVKKLAELKKISIQEAIGLIVISKIDQKRGEQITDPDFEEAGFTKNGQSRKAYKAKWMREKRKCGHLLSTNVDSYCPRGMQDNEPKTNDKKNNVDNYCPQMWTPTVHTTYYDEEGKEDKPPKTNTKKEKENFLVTPEVLSYNSRERNSELTINSKTPESKLINDNLEKKKKVNQKRKKESTWSSDFDDLDFQDVLQGKVDHVKKKDLKLAAIRKWAADAYKHVFGFKISSESIEIKKAIKSLVLDEGRKPSEIMKAIFGIEKDTWKDRKKHRSFRYIHKSFDTWLELYESAPDSAETGTWGPWRDEGFATREAWEESQQEITIEGDGSWV